MEEKSPTQELKDSIQSGWKVRITDHDYIMDSRDALVDQVTESGMTLRPSKPWASQGRKFFTMDFTWSGDLVVDGTTVHLYRTPPKHTGKSRQVIKTFKFTAPLV
ncbi:hypothetical protein [Streptomyces sp. H27-C3]|uniref:hypothetical protein n=1 Tax=Streptomyces sp. H27-C3 TaxID=3046305 RepID=UPI0024BA1329|nr:hypothetical protein [Streptomyces sp. H27-C3]MDJ0463088.1 hypothetical protein [Streptomyces sp. H27-C3]